MEHTQDCGAQSRSAESGRQTTRTDRRTHNIVSDRESCNEERVRSILDAAATVERLTQRRAADGDRRVSLVDGRYVLKRYAFERESPPARTPWRQEHKTLQHLADVWLPESIGYVEDQEDGARVIRYLRTYVPGMTLSEFDASSVREAGRVIGTLHASGVVTDDAQTHNFIRDPHGRLLFVDFGKARIFSPRNPLRLVWIALEHCRFLRASIDWNKALWAEFRNSCFEAAGLNGAERAGVRAVTALLLWQRRIRRGEHR